MVIGLLCDEQGTPVSTEVFRGNTQDPKTFAAQVKKASERFGWEGHAGLDGGFSRQHARSENIRRAGEEGE